MLYNDCPVCDSADVVELSSPIKVHGIWAIDYYTLCNVCKVDYATGWQLNATVWGCRAAGCYKTEEYKKFREGYSNGKEDCLLNS